MCSSNWGRVAIVLGLIVINSEALPADGQPLSIYEIQSNTIDGDASEYNGQVVNVTEALVVRKLRRTVERLVLADTDHPDGWGGIQAKDLEGVGAFNDLETGDRILLTNVKVEEYRGTTFLQWLPANNPGVTVVSSGNSLPPPVMVSVSDIPAPIYDPVTYGWFVENHDAEPYESMRLVVRDVTVTARHLGKAEDNYNLQNAAEEECWTSDYLNADKPAWEEYHDFVSMGRHFCALAGMLEQYTKLSNDFDYYQLLTTSTVDLAICGDGTATETWISTTCRGFTSA